MDEDPRIITVLQKAQQKTVREHASAHQFIISPFEVIHGGCHFY